MKKRYGISSWIASILSADEAIEKIAAAGFREIELSGSGSGLLHAWEDDPICVCQKLTSKDIVVKAIHCPVAGRSIDDADEATRQASVAANLVYFDKMRSCRIKGIIIHPFGSGDYSTQVKKIVCRAQSLKSLRAMAEMAGEMGVRIAVENLAKGRPGSNVADLLEMIEGMGDHVGICIDLGHAYIAGLDLINELRAAVSAGKLFSLHIHDVNEAGRDHFIPGEGKIDWDIFISRLDACGFQGGRILEISPPETDVDGRLCKAAIVRDKWEGYEI